MSSFGYHAETIRQIAKRDDEITQLRAENAVLAAQNWQLREALSECRGWLDSDDCYGRDTIDVANSALSLPDLSTLPLARVMAEAFRKAADLVEDYQASATGSAEYLRVKADEIEKRARI